jgi:hypothetical protein
MEVHALARWADKRSQKDTTYDQDIILLGDMNVPDMTLKQASYRALIEYGMQPLKYASRIDGSNLSGKNIYDQMAFAPGRLQTRIIDYDVFFLTMRCLPACGTSSTRLRTPTNACQNFAAM